MKKVLIAATLALALVVPAAAPAGAEPASASAAFAFGLRSEGLIPIAATPTAGPVSQPPDSTDGPNSVLNIPLRPLALAAASNAFAQARRESNIRTTLFDPAGIEGESKPTVLQDVNAKALARTAVAEAVITGDVTDPIVAPILEIINDALVGATAIDAEAVAKCVNGRAQFDYGYDLVGVGLAGHKLNIVDQIVSAVVNLLGGRTGGTTPVPIPEGTPIASILRVETPELPRPEATVVRTEDGISVTALRVISDLLGLRIDISHAEVRMPVNCGIAPPRPTGPGPVAPTRALAATGDDMGTWPLVAFGVLGTAVILRRTMLRSSRRAA